jgi:hypothetical protein
MSLFNLSFIWISTLSLLYYILLIFEISKDYKPKSLNFEIVEYTKVKRFWLLSIFRDIYLVKTFKGNIYYIIKRKGNRFKQDYKIISDNILMEE